MQAPRTTSDIIGLFKERGLPVKRSLIDAIDDEFVYSKTSAETQEWVSTHLTADTLLSREEATLYEKLDSSGALQPILHDPNLGATRPFHEDEMRSAIASLEASTTAIERQTKTLSFQCEMLRKQLQNQEEWAQERDRDLARLLGKHEAEKQRTEVAAKELSDELEASFRNMVEKTAMDNKRILALLSSRLKQDDRELAELEDLISKIKFDGNDAATVERAGQLSDLLAGYRAEEIHYRLDRLYLQDMLAESSKPSSSGSEPILARSYDVAALEEELAALYPEIEILAEMSTKQQYQDPILRAIHHQHSRLQVASEQQLEQVLDVLIDMTQSKKGLTEKLRERESWCELLEQLANLYQAEVGQPLTTQPPSSRRDSLRRRSLQPGTLLAVPRSSDVISSNISEIAALGSLLRRLGVSPESLARAHAENGDSGGQNLYEKRLEFTETLQALSLAGDAPLLSELGSADKAYYLLASALHRDSEYAISLRDGSLKKALSDLDSELGQLQKGIQGLNLGVLHQRDPRRDRFMERWGV
ncbi:hypothetical protein PDE_04066 [Penicillium oxalicum 114-2]|uniref:HAUS augmin-like complex subunit 3 N-terminal domain-containing protein n=1 Tax=Penicillium oxalicum (strain 114-2 / CGMCC 5302) TaxID=933388 RepID=S8B3L8_PENO1|nr:hypothetical protein PDE_04066 [Penicillium oxalicum 114-2]